MATRGRRAVGTWEPIKHPRDDVSQYILHFVDSPFAICLCRWASPVSSGVIGARIIVQLNAAFFDGRKSRTGRRLSDMPQVSAYGFAQFDAAVRALPTGRS